MNWQYTILFLFFLWGSVWNAGAQTEGAPLDSLPADTAASIPDSLPLDTMQVMISPGVPEAPIDYQAVDSMHFNLLEQRLYLYGSAQVNYQQTELKADYIEVDFQNSLIYARPYPDSSGQLAGFPYFREGTQEFTAEEMKYNYESQKGIIYQGRTQQGDLYLVGKQSKLIMAGKAQTDDLIYNRNVIISTCNHPEPHYGIRAQKLKIIPEKMVIVGPSNLEIANVATPLFLPFGFFPITETRSAGLIFPNGYEYSPTLGYGISNIGYFTPLGETMNLKLMGEIYTRGSFGVVGDLNYKKRYKYSGTATMSYRVLRQESQTSLEYIRRPSFFISWNHRQEAKAHPYNNFSARLKFQVDNQVQTFQTGFNDQAQNIYNTNVVFTRRFPDGLFTLTTSLDHTQNTFTRDVLVQFPSYTATMKRVFPFQRKVSGGTPRWYEQFSVSYNSSGLVQFEGKDTTFFRPETVQNAEYGIRHNANADINFRLFKFFNFRPSVDYREDWYFRTYREFFDNTLIITQDTITNEDGEIINIIPDTTFVGQSEVERSGFTPLREYSLSTSLDFSLYGLAQFRKFFVRGIRHTLRSNFSFAYNPDFTDPSFGYFDTYEGPDGEPVRYSIFRPEAGLRGPSTGGKRMSLGFSFTNNVEAKVYSKRDSALKKITLLNNFRFSGSYNFAADSFNLSKITGGGLVRFLNGMSTMNVNLTFDPYAVEGNRRVNTYYWETDRKPLRFERLGMRFDTDLTLDGIKALFGSKESAAPQTPREGAEPEEGPPPGTVGPNGLEDLEAIIRGLTINHDLNVERVVDPTRGLDTIRITAHNVRLSLRSLQLSTNWSMRIGNIGYDFLRKRITYPDFTFTRDLHCWSMSLSVQPTFGTYQFRIGVKPGSLDFIDIPYRKNPQDASSFRF